VSDFERLPRETALRALDKQERLLDELRSRSTDSPPPRPPFTPGLGLPETRGGQGGGKT